MNFDWEILQFSEELEMLILWHALHLLKHLQSCDDTVHVQEFDAALQIHADAVESGSEMLEFGQFVQTVWSMQL